MASIELGPLSQHIDADDIATIESAFADADIDLDLDDEADGRLLDGNLDDDLLADFLDRLDANGAACDIYIPGDFEDPVEAADHTIGSSHALLMVLEELQDDLFASEDEEEEEAAAADSDSEDFDEFEDDDEPQARYGGHGESVDIQDEQLRALWKLLYKGARTAIRDRVCLFIHR